MKNTYQVIIIGAGATGSGLARDLALRGVSCLLLEQGDVNAGASGRNHGLLHSGARYAINDPSAAAECAHEGAILKRIMPQCIDDCGGIFAAVPGDDENYIAMFPEHCAKAGIACEELSPAQARDMEPALSPHIIAAYRVPDASVDPFMLSLENVADAMRHGSTYLRRRKVVGFTRKAGDSAENSRIASVQTINLETGKEESFFADEFVITAGAWSGQVAALAGCTVDLLLSKGTLLIAQTRLAKRVINRLRKPGDGDILVPGGSVSVLGTTSIQVDDPNDNFPTIAEVDANLAEGIPLLPILATAPLRRAYAGIRPLIKAPGGGDGRKVSRDFSLIDHHKPESGGVDNLLTLAGGKLTTYRLMAERTADVLVQRLGIAATPATLCRTADLVLEPSTLAEWIDPGLAHKYSWWQKHSPQDYLLCECEVVPQSAVDNVVENLQENSHSLPGESVLSGISALSRAGKGSCQGTFCGTRMTAHLYDCAKLTGTEGVQGLKTFLRERWSGQWPVLWGDQLSQAELKEALYFGLMGLNDLPDDAATPENTAESTAHAPASSQNPDINS